MNAEDNLHKEISLVSIILAIKEYKYSLSVIFVSSMILLTLYIASMPTVYRSSSLLYASNVSSQSSISSSVGGLASIAGINLPSKEFDLSKLAVEKIKSRDFLNKLVLKYDLLPYLFAAKSFDKNSNKIIFNSSVYDENKKEWVNAKNSFGPSLEESHARYKKILNININESNGFVSISIDHISPVFSKFLLETIIFEIDEIMRKEALIENQLYLDFLYKEFNSNKLSEIKIVISRIIESEIQNAMMINSSQNYVFSIIDGPNLPEKKHKPDRILFIIFSLIISLGLSFAYLVIKLALRSTKL